VQCPMEACHRQSLEQANRGAFNSQRGQAYLLQCLQQPTGMDHSPIHKKPNPPHSKKADQVMAHRGKLLATKATVMLGDYVW